MELVEWWPLLKPWGRGRRARISRAFSPRGQRWHDKRWGALISFALSSPACPAQSDTHVWWWLAGAYRIMDIDRAAVETQCAFGQKCSQQCALNGANLALVSARHLRQPAPRNCGRSLDLCESLHHSKNAASFLNAGNSECSDLSQRTSLKLTATFKRLVLVLVIK